MNSSRTAINRVALSILPVLVPLLLNAQQDATISGQVRTKDREAVPEANVSIKGNTRGTTTNEKGRYSLAVPADTTFVLHYSHTAYQAVTHTLKLSPGADSTINVTLHSQTFEEVIIEDEESVKGEMMRIPSKSVSSVPSATGDFVNKTLSAQPGVSMNNELSSSYSVRGGNFDENLVYVNGFRVYRPFLVRSGRQEGLSFVNSDLVSDIKFSAGGFNATYGDKMSSVLDIQYKEPTEEGGSFTGSLLGGQVHYEGTDSSGRFTHLTGVRYRKNQYVLNSLQTEGQYDPRFLDLQSYLTYQLSDQLQLGFLTNISQNRYRFIPQSRQTRFGNIDRALQLTIAFQGQEADRFDTYFGGLTGLYEPNERTTLRFTSSTFRTLETETFDLIGRFRIDELQRNLGSEDFGDVIQNRGVGAFHDHGRNTLDGTVWSLTHDGDFSYPLGQLEWGARYQREFIDDRLSEWHLIDSAGYSLPHPPDSIGYEDPDAQPDHKLKLNRSVKADNSTRSNRYSAYVNNTLNWQTGRGDKLNLTTGIRGQYWDFNEETVISPRGEVTWIPEWYSQQGDTLIRRNVKFRLAAGFYHQPPFYREIRGLNGEIHPEVKAQRAIHYVLGAEYVFKAWDRPFKLSTELFYKDLDRLNPYEVDNVRIRYYAENSAHGYAAGVDTKINGEFIEGMESWFSLSLMQTEADIEGDIYYEGVDGNGDPIPPGSNETPADSVATRPGFIPRPTDQRVNIGVFFQDRMPRWPSYKVHLNLLYGSPLPFGPPSFERYKDTLRTPAYRRVDLGFSKEFLTDKDNIRQDSFWRHFESIRLSLEVFNLLDIRNTINYLWIQDVQGRQLAVPNRLTGRRVNVKVAVEF